MDNEVKTADTPKVRPFNVMDQMVAHRLAIEGFEILGVVPSNKYADKAHFIFTFNSNSKFQKRFKAILAEVESGSAEQEKEAADTAAELERLRTENEKLKAELCEKTAENAKKSSKSASKTAKTVSKTGKSCEISEETYRSDMDEIRDTLAGLEALGNCILSNVAALNFYKRLHGESKEE